MSVLFCLAVLLAGTGAHAAQPEEVPFRSGELTLHGFIFRPSGNGPFPAVLYNHGRTHQEGHGKFCFSGGAAWGPEVFSFLDVTMAEQRR